MLQRILPLGLALILLQGSVPCTAQTHAVGVRDGAKLFSADAVQMAEQSLRRLEREHRWQVVIETVESLNGQMVETKALETAKELQLHGLYVLISKHEHKIWIEPSQSARAVYSKSRINSIVDSLTRDFRAKEFDKGLKETVDAIRGDAETHTRVGSSPTVAKPPAPEQGPSSKSTRSGDPTWPPASPKAPAPPAPPTSPAAPAPPQQASSNMPLLIGAGVGVLVLLFLLSKAFGRPQQAPPNYQQQPVSSPQGYGGGQPQGGYAPDGRPTGPGGPGGYGPGGGGPGYGPGAGPGYGPGYGQPPGYGPGYGQPPAPARGGGFVSGMLGGIGGAVVGNMLYDEFGRPHPSQGAPPHEVNSGGVAPTQPPSGGHAEPPAESYDPNAGAGGDWGGGDASTNNQHAGNEANAAGWGYPAPDANPARGGDEWNQGAGAGGDWGGGDAPAADEAASGDWGDDSAGTPDNDDSAGGGGDWSDDSGNNDNQQGGDW